MDYKVTTSTVKVAWVRNAGAPVGKPARGRLQCPCGNAPETEFKPGPDVVCACGKVYTWDGRDKNLIVIDPEHIRSESEYVKTSLLWLYEPKAKGE